MDFILPIPITDSLFVSSTLPETDYPLWLAITTYSKTSRVIVSTPNIHKIYESLTNSNTGNYPPEDSTNWLEISATNRWKCFDEILGTQAEGSITPDILDEDCADISDWSDADTGTGVSEVDPAGQFRFDTNTGAVENAHSERQKIITSPPTKFTIEVKIYFDSLGATTDTDYALLYYNTETWRFQAKFSSDKGLELKSSSSYSTVCALDCNGTASWQTLRFEVDRSAGDANATADVYLNGIMQGTFDCDYEGSFVVDGTLDYCQYGNTTNDMVSHIEYIKIATGLGAVDTTVTSFNYVLTPGVCDSVALLNLDATSIQVAVTPANLIGEDDSPLEQEENTDNILAESYDSTVDVTNKTDLVLTDLVCGATDTLTITINKPAGAPKVGEIIVGNKTFIGDMQYSPSIGIKDWSTKDVDVYGHYTITPRTYSKWMKVSLVVLMAALDALTLNLATYRSTPLVWVGSETYSSLIIYGYYTDFSIVLPYPAYAICQLEIEGLT
jgi:hypothetical protein